MYRRNEKSHRTMIGFLKQCEIFLYNPCNIGCLFREKQVSQAGPTVNST